MTMTITSIRRGSSAPIRIARLLGLSILLLATSATTASAQYYSPPRVRFGINGHGGGFVGATHGAVGGLGVRLGVQVNDLFAVYVQGQGLIGQFLPSPGDGLAGFAFHSLMFELTLADVVQLGLGPALDFVWGCDGTYQPSCAGTGPYLGGDARLAVVLGGRGPGRRSGLEFSFDVHPTWFGETASVALLFGLGYELY